MTAVAPTNRRRRRSSRCGRIVSKNPAKAVSVISTPPHYTANLILWRTLSVDRMEDVFEDAILIPWSMRGPLSSEYVDRHTEFLATHYSERSVTLFQTAVKRFNRRDRLPGHNE